MRSARPLARLVVGVGGQGVELAVGRAGGHVSQQHRRLHQRVDRQQHRQRDQARVGRLRDSSAGLSRRRPDPSQTRSEHPDRGPIPRRGTRPFSRPGRLPSVVDTATRPGGPHADRRAERRADARSRPVRRWARCCAATGTRWRSPGSWPSSRSSGSSCSGSSSRCGARPAGRYGIVPEPCPHRKASMAYGVVEADGLRCPYHGWKFDTDGACTEQPAERENTKFQTGCGATAGKVEELGGLVWAYVGPAGRPAPLLPRFDIYVMDGLPRHRLGRPRRATTCRSWRTRSTRTTSSSCTGATSSSSAATRASPRPPSFGKEHVRASASTPFEWGIIKRRVLEGAIGGERRLEGRAPAGLPVQHARRRRRRPPDADPGADQPHHHPVHALHGARARGLRARRAAARSPTTRSRCSTSAAATSPTTSRARTSWPG